MGNKQGWYKNNAIEEIITSELSSGGTEVHQVGANELINKKHMSIEYKHCCGKYVDTDYEEIHNCEDHKVPITKKVTNSLCLHLKGTYTVSMLDHDGDTTVDRKMCKKCDKDVTDL